MDDKPKEYIGLNFGDAIEALKKGSRVARGIWVGHEWIYAECLENVPHRASTIDVRFIMMKTNEVKLQNWIPGPADLFAEDWMILI